MEKGAAFLMGVLRGREKHLWVVISDITKHCGSGVIVNISTNIKRSGGECPLAMREHPWLDKPESWVCYGDAALISAEGWINIRDGITNGLIVPQPKCSDAMTCKIIQGAKDSAAKPDGAFRKDYLAYLD